MDKARTREILQSLADGIDPYSGEIFPPNSPYQHPDTVRALYAVLPLLEETAKPRNPTLPAQAGKAWSSEEDAHLMEAFDAGTSIAELAKSHARTRGAITARLVKLGKLEQPARAPYPPAEPKA